MKRLTSVFLVGAAIAGAFLAGGWRARRGGAEGAPARKILHWVDPMHPAYTSDGPGIAPDCGMQLEPVYEDGGPATAAAPGEAPLPGTVNIGPETQQRFGVRVGQVERTSARHTLRLFGRVVPDETRVYTVNAPLDGIIKEVSGATTGSFVRRGQWLTSYFALDSRLSILAYISSLDVADRAKRLSAQADAKREAGDALVHPIELQNAEATIQLSAERVRGIAMSEEQLAEVARTRKAPLAVRVAAPASGVLLARNAVPGRQFMKGEEWYRIADLSRVWILADVFEGDATHLRPGARAEVTVPGQARTLTARVSDVPPQFDPATRTLKARLEVENPGAALRPDMFVDVALQVELPEADVVPADAVVDGGLTQTVFVERGEGRFEPRTVKLGWRAGDRVEIVAGLTPGERIVVAGTFLVDSESRMKAAAAGFTSTVSRDPVCGMAVDEAKARAAGRALEVGGKRHVFCSDGCKHQFEKSSGLLAGGEGRSL